MQKVPEGYFRSLNIPFPMNPNEVLFGYVKMLVLVDDGELITCLVAAARICIPAEYKALPCLENGLGRIWTTALTTQLA